MWLLDSSNPQAKVLVAVLAGILLLLLFEFTVIKVGLGDTSLPDTAQLDADAQSPRLIPIADFDSYQATIQRSLFNWNRRPREVPTGDEQEQGELSTRWRLTGIINTGSETYAIFNQEDGVQLRLAKGMYLEKWRIDDISPEQVSLSSDGEEQFFRLQETATENSNRPGNGNAVRRAGSASTKSKQETLTNTNNKGGQQ